jgi:shikimate kinase/3-dehydroquinate synthase
MKELIFLYGPSGSGKTRVGELLARKLHQPFADLDGVIEARAGMTIPEIFAGEAESGFRRQERRVLDEMLANHSGVLALGGGALLDEDNWSRVRAAGPIVCLTASMATLLDRLRGDEDQRPLLSECSAQSLRTLLDQRADHYASFRLQLDADGLSPEQVAREAQIMLGRFHVSGMGHSYDVRVQAGGLQSLGEGIVARGMRGPCMLVSDENVGALYGDEAMKSVRRAGFDVHKVILPAGESNKNLASISRLWESFLAAGLERGSTVVALGGGVVGDLAGFAASTFMRGVAWVNVPTSIMAMVDASLGGKTGANLPQGKNLIGAFHAPRLVLADPQTLTTLPDVEFSNGLAEVVKHAVISDPHLLTLCAKGKRAVHAQLEQIVSRSMAVKIDIIQGDPYESSWREVLNLGHTVGHAIEQLSNYRIRHGEAISMGMVAEARMSEDFGIAQAGLVEELVRVLTGLDLPVEIPDDIDRDRLPEAMGVDKKRSHGALRFALPVEVGRVRNGVEIENLEEMLAKL